MQFPIITKFSTQDNFGYLWLKYVTGYDLSVHCARCLKGKYSDLFNANVKEINNIELKESECKYYYLCGVTRPYKYNNNLHLCFKYKDGSEIDYFDGKTMIHILNAERINIFDLLEQYLIEPNGNKCEYNTCRNWRFAFQMKYNIGL